MIIHEGKVYLHWQQAKWSHVDKMGDLRPKVLLHVSVHQIYWFVGGKVWSIDVEKINRFRSSLDFLFPFQCIVDCIRYLVSERRCSCSTLFLPQYKMVIENDFPAPPIFTLFRTEITPVISSSSDMIKPRPADDAKYMKLFLPGLPNHEKRKYEMIAKLDNEFPTRDITITVRIRDWAAICR